MGLDRCITPRLLRALKTDLVGVAAGRLSAPAVGERHRAGLGALPEEDARTLLGEAVGEATGAWGALVQGLWDKATSQIAGKCMAMLQVDTPLLRNFVRVQLDFPLPLEVAFHSGSMVEFTDPTFHCVRFHIPRYCTDHGQQIGRGYRLWLFPVLF